MSRALSSVKRRKRNQKLLKIGLIFLLLLLLLVGVVAGLFFVEKFKIKEVTVEGAIVLSQDQLREDVENYLSKKVFFLIPRNRFFTLNTDCIEQMLLDKYKKLEKAEVKKEYPFRLLVNVKERSAAATLCREDESRQCFYLDKTGYIFDEAPYFSEGIFVMFFDRRALKPSLGQHLINEEDLKNLLEFRKMISDILDVVEIGIEKDGFYNFYSKDGWYLSMGEINDMDLLYDNLKVFYNEVAKEKETELEYIDLRFGNKVFYKWK